MSFLNSFDISVYRIDCTKAEAGYLAENIANAQTTRTADGCSIP